jgi:hypothetical protein
MLEVAYYDATLTPAPGPNDFLWSTSYSSGDFKSLAEFRAKVETDGQAIRAAHNLTRNILDTLSIGQEIIIP